MITWQRQSCFYFYIIITSEGKLQCQATVTWQEHKNREYFEWKTQWLVATLLIALLQRMVWTFFNKSWRRITTLTLGGDLLLLLLLLLFFIWTSKKHWKGRIEKSTSNRTLKHRLCPPAGVGGILRNGWQRPFSSATYEHYEWMNNWNPRCWKERNTFIDMYLFKLYRPKYVSKPLYP